MDNVHKPVGGLHKTPLPRALLLKGPKAADLDAFLTYRTHTHAHKTFTINLTLHKRHGFPDMN